MAFEIVHPVPPVEFVDVLTVKCHPKQGSALLSWMNKQLPSELTHLKRTRKAEDGSLETVVGTLESIGDEIKQQMLQCFEKIEFSTAKVSRAAPGCREDVAVASSYWPLLLAPGKLKIGAPVPSHQLELVERHPMMSLKAIDESEWDDIRPLVEEMSKYVNPQRRCQCGAVGMRAPYLKMSSLPSHVTEHRSELEGFRIISIGEVEANFSRVKKYRLDQGIEAESKLSLRSVSPWPLHSKMQHPSLLMAHWMAVTSNENQEQDDEKKSLHLLTGADIFLTQEPCMMCAMALVHSRCRSVTFLQWRS